MRVDPVREGRAVRPELPAGRPAYPAFAWGTVILENLGEVVLINEKKYHVPGRFLRVVGTRVRYDGRIEAAIEAAYKSSGRSEVNLKLRGNRVSDLQDMFNAAIHRRIELCDLKELNYEWDPE